MLLKVLLFYELHIMLFLALFLLYSFLSYLLLQDIVKIIKNILYFFVTRPIFMFFVFMSKLFYVNITEYQFLILLIIKNVLSLINYK